MGAGSTWLTRRSTLGRGQPKPEADQPPADDHAELPPAARPAQLTSQPRLSGRRLAVPDRKRRQVVTKHVDTSFERVVALRGRCHQPLRAGLEGDGTLALRQAQLPCKARSASGRYGGRCYVDTEGEPAEMTLKLSHIPSDSWPGTRQTIR